jgi:3-oxo-4,17-pregnadiene-20-carboxyl-CoA hydratase alpha subunit
MSKEQADFMAKMQSYVDAGVEGIKTSWDEINRPMIRHWAQAMNDKNPIYTDAEFAATTRHGGLVAPPTMLQAWTMKGLEGPAPGSSIADPMADVSSVMIDAGYAAVVATNCEQTYFRYVKPGEKLHHKDRLESISEEKKTALGVGYFLTQLLEYFTEEGEKVAEMRFTILRYKPAMRET